MKKREGPPVPERTETKTSEEKKKEALIEEKRWTIGAIIVRIGGEKYTVTPPDIEDKDPLVLEKLDKLITNLEELYRIIKEIKATIASANNKKEILKMKESLARRGYIIIPEDEKALEYALIQGAFEKHLDEEKK